MSHVYVCQVPAISQCIIDDTNEFLFLLNAAALGDWKEHAVSHLTIVKQQWSRRLPQLLLRGFQRYQSLSKICNLTDCFAAGAALGVAGMGTPAADRDPAA